MNTSAFLSVAQLAKILGISRIAVFQKIKRGDIHASKVGRAYIIDSSVVDQLHGNSLSTKEHDRIDVGVRKAVREYGETLKLLGKE